MITRDRPAVARSSATAAYAEAADWWRHGSRGAFDERTLEIARGARRRRRASGTARRLTPAWEWRALLLLHAGLVIPGILLQLDHLR